MQSFENIAAENATIPVTLVGNRAVNGVLKLDDRKTSLNLLSTKFFHFETNDKGWCDIALLGPKGHRITAHNAVFSSSGQSWGSGRKRMHHASIFPNTLVMDSRGHTSDGKVAQISFRLMGFNDFFHYQYTEQLSPFELNEDAKSLLKSLRYADQNKFDSFDLSHIYICHQPKDIFNFDVADRKYSVWSAGRGTFLDWHGINLSIEHGATIQFETPVSIDDALDRVYEWRQFFNQMAMVPLSIEAISIAATNKKRAVESDVYIPYLTEQKQTRKGIYGLHPAHLPLNNWEDRDRLATCMKNWLEMAKGRRAFRGRLDVVIEHMQEGVHQSDISELCAGIDSLGELDRKSEFPDTLLQKMSEAAVEAVGQSEQKVTVERMKGLLGQLQNRSLSEKMMALALQAFPENHASDTKVVVRLANRMRQDASHRGIVRDQLHSALQPVVDALACICVAFDLGHCGVPFFETGRSANCIRRFFNCTTELSRFSQVQRVLEL